MTHHNKQLTLAEFEQALDAGRLELAMSHGAWWRARRNGRTKTWKRDPTRWAVPVKAGLRTCTTINDNTSAGYYRIVE